MFYRLNVSIVQRGRSGRKIDPRQIDSVDMKEAGDLILIPHCRFAFYMENGKADHRTIVEVGRGNLAMNDLKSFLHNASDEPLNLRLRRPDCFGKSLLPGDHRLRDLRPVLEVSSPMIPRHQDQEKDTKEKK